MILVENRRANETIGKRVNRTLIMAFDLCKPDFPGPNVYLTGRSSVASRYLDVLEPILEGRLRTVLDL